MEILCLETYSSWVLISGGWRQESRVGTPCFPSSELLRLRLVPDGMFRTPNRSASDIVAAAFERNLIGRVKPKGLYFKGLAETDVSAEARDKAKRKMV